jgi:hypothetical protein
MELCLSSGNICAFPGCTQIMYDRRHKVTIDHIVHIQAVGESGPRYNASQTPVQRNSFENLMLMCPNHHTLVDKAQKTYTVKALKKMKRDHEERQQGKVSKGLSNEMVYALLEQIGSRNVGEEIASRMRPADVTFDRDNFDRVLNRYEKCTGLKMKWNILKGELESAISTIPTERSKWKNDVKEIAERILRIGIREISSSTYVEHWLSNLSHVLSYSDNKTHALYVEKLRGKIALLKKERPNIPLVEIVQQVNGYDVTTIETLVDYSLNIWSREEFDQLIVHVDFKRLWKSNPEFMNSLRDKLLEYGNMAESEADQEKEIRLKRLDDVIRMSKYKDMPVSFL